MNRPTATEVQGWSEVPDLVDVDAPRAAMFVAYATRMFERLTGLSFAEVAEADEPLVQMAVRGIAEMAAIEGTADAAETLADFHLIQNFSAGRYSENRRSPEDMLKARMIHPWPWVNSLLWLVMKPGRKDEWDEFFGGAEIPASSVTEIDWSEGGAYGSEYLPGY